MFRSMRSTSALALAFSFALASAAFAAAQTSPAAGPAIVGTSDGGTRQTLESLFIPPKSNAPFSLVLATEWVRPMLGGGTVTSVNQRRIMRDSAGRIYQERWLLVPKGGKIASQMSYIQIADPLTHLLYNCAVPVKRCFVQRYAGSVQADYRPSTHPSGPLPNGEGFLLHEDLGAANVAGLPATGVRETTTVNPGVFGNDQPMVTLREFWFSEPLGIDLSSRLESPSTGNEQFTVTEITTNEPEASFFALPAGYTLVDQRATAPISAP